ncbi:alpha/beta hydrolase [Mesoterricola silvestris]|uniref:Acetylhydrolase n=1 Tax=Mesoterricola silvestris TaxID=2927979 RepID=A0AA48GYS1_9BACT|nr:alpha/beta hydrolase [Mesoterricola silvestris]BDU74341.1 acetylhydrolase [Mesoterricola silvestris]
MTVDFYPTYKSGRLHPECEALLAQIAQGGGLPVHAMSPSEARRGFLPPEWLEPPREEIAIRKTTAGAVPIRIYTPHGAGLKPVLVFFHGGGFVAGNLDEFDSFCTLLAEGARCIVVAVDYRLAPESPFPAAVEDAWAATRWVASHAVTFGGDASRLAVAGDSAGANLAAVVSMRAREDGGPGILHQVLICPWVDLSPGSEATESFRHFGEGLWLSTKGIEWYRHHYLTDPAQAGDPLASPLLAGTFENLPPALVLTAEFDVLADQGRAYAQRLEAAGVPVTFRCFPGMLHDFVVFPKRITPAWAALNQITSCLKDAFAGHAAAGPG